MLTIYGKEQNRQIIEHELVHICMHDHPHNYKTEKDLQQHLYTQKYDEETIAITLAPCLVTNRYKLSKALEQHNVHLH
jgi:antirestriction protein ArdC